MDKEIKMLQGYIDNSTDGVSHIPNRDVQDIIDYLLALREENRKIRETHYHESVLDLLRYERG